MKKTVVVDFSDYDSMCGFGEIARNYCPRLAAAEVPHLHFVFILPDRHRGEFGSHIDYVSSEHLRREIRAYRGKIHLWHATHQQFRYRLRGKGIVQLLTVHDLNYLYEKHGIHLLRHQIEMPWLIRRSDYVTTISEYVRNDIKAHIPFLDKEPQVVYNGISDVETCPQRRPSFVGEKEPFFMCIGQVREKKNIHRLVPMMKYFPNHKLLICGDNHWTYANDIRNLISAQGDTERILMTGKISNEEKVWLYAHADALLFPSRLEGFGIPVLEAMRFGTKVFSSRLSCMPEVCGAHASYWDDFEPERMAETVRKGLAAWDRNGQAAMAARDYSRTFSYDRYTQEYVKLYCKLLEI